MVFQVDGFAARIGSDGGVYHLLRFRRLAFGPDLSIHVSIYLRYLQIYLSTPCCACTMKILSRMTLLEFVIGCRSRKREYAPPSLQIPCCGPKPRPNPLNPRALNPKIRKP